MKGRRICGMCGKVEKVTKLGYSDFVQALGDYCLPCVVKAMKSVPEVPQSDAAEPEGRFNCVLCGVKLAKGASSAICTRCARRRQAQDVYPDD